MAPTVNANSTTTMIDPMTVSSSASSPTDTQDRRDQTQFPGTTGTPADEHHQRHRDSLTHSRSQSDSPFQFQSQSYSQFRPDQTGSNPDLQSSMGPMLLAPSLPDHPIQTPSQHQHQSSPAKSKSNSLQSLISVVPDSQPIYQEKSEPRAHLSNFIPEQAEANSNADQAKTTPSSTYMVPARNPVPEALANRDHNYDPDSDLDLDPPIENILDPIITTQEIPVDSERSASTITKRRRLNTDLNPSSTMPQHPMEPLSNNHKHNRHKSLPIKPFPTTTTSTSLPPFPIEIHPPPPPISTSPFTTHITQTLSMLTQRLKPERIYNPIQKTRELDIWERGYWAVPITITLDTNPNPDIPNTSKNWTIPFFNRFWSFLSEFIGKDTRAGWGVWCIAEKMQNVTDPDPDPLPLPSTASTDELSTQESNSNSNANANAETLTSDTGTISVLVKVYTWGEVVMHVYLLLFLASERRVRGLGAEWRDASEKVVIRMSR
ncbi:hypothetical protein PENSTE_c005G07221 [Penicillium steckii]|uniref:Uncharacterized protein n=1 Tax=Penicillium steckii TaxID=303698 RepID=A0A1V6TIQ5_9EURO|nr:hypothetical protein PENSTE_c005G07221 [Penicillium steckii]